MTMTTGGYVFLIVCWTVITIAFAYCTVRTIRGGFKE